MKHLFTLLLAFGAYHVATAQSCCQKPIEFQTLAMSTAFKESHEAPIPFHYESKKGSMVTFNCLDGKTGQAWYVPTDEPTNRVLLIFHEWWGVNDYMKREAVRWQEVLGNVDVYVVDLFDGKVADDPDVASQLASGLDPKRGEAIVKGALVKAGKDKLIATLGWCMGGSWSFTAALDADKQASGCVMYYGFPEQKEKRIKALKTDVLYIWGNQDAFIKKYHVTQFEERVKATQHKFELHEYDAPHAFANPSNPKFNALAATQAENLAVKFLKEHLAIE